MIFIKTEDFLRNKIKQEGRISSKAFIDICLYGENGYYTYTRKAKNSYFKDYATAPLTHPLFGFLISIFLDRLIKELDSNEKINIYEIGAGNGTLAYDINQGFESLNQQNYKYFAIDQEKSNYTFPVLSKKENLPKSNGIILSNELFDSIPHHLFCIKNGLIYERFVELDKNNFIETLDTPSDKCIERRIEKLNLELNDVTGEIICKNSNIFSKFESLIHKGFILTIDYGMREKNLFFNGKKNSFMSVINNHSFYNDYFYKPGLTDITFQVDIDDYKQEIKQIGFTNEFLISQRQFLFELGIGEYLKILSEKSIKMQDLDTNRYAINQLIKPNGMGNYFVSLESNFKNNFKLEDLTENKNKFSDFPFIAPFPQRFELPGIYKQNNIINEDWINNE